MELLFEFLIELIFEGSIEVAKNKKISKWIRYPLILIILLFIISVISLILFLGILLMIKEKTFIAGTLLILIDVILIILGIKNTIKEIKLIKKQ